jgi:STE24 endopeptidase
MNVFSIVILAALILEFTLDLVANLLNLKALKLELPPNLEGIYNAEDYRKSQEYIRATTRFGLLSSTFTSFLLLAFWFSGGFNYFDKVIRAWEFVPVVSGLLYIGILLLAYGLLMLPFSIYSTFVIEDRFGFNKTTPRTFFLDQIKGLALAVLLGGPLLAGILVPSCINQRS